MSEASRVVTPEIRPAIASDLSGIVELLTSCGLPSSDLSPAHLTSFFVATVADRLIGVAGVETFGDVGLLRSLAVLPEFRSGGVAQRLVSACENLASSKPGVSALYLLTTTAADYFLRRAYVEVPRDVVPAEVAAHPQFRGLCPASARCLKKVLTCRDECSSPVLLGTVQQVV